MANQLGDINWGNSINLGEVIRSSSDRDALYAAVVRDDEVVETFVEKVRAVIGKDSGGRLVYAQLENNQTNQSLLRKAYHDKAEFALVPSIGLGAINQDFGDVVSIWQNGNLNIMTNGLSIEVPEINESGGGEDYEIESLDARIQRRIDQIETKLPGPGNKGKRAAKYHLFLGHYMEKKEAGDFQGTIPPNIDTSLSANDAIEVYTTLHDAAYQPLLDGVDAILSEIGVAAP